MMKRRRASRTRWHDPRVLPSLLDTLDEHSSTTTRTTTQTATPPSPSRPTPAISSYYYSCRPRPQQTSYSCNKRCRVMHRHTAPRMRLHPPSRCPVVWIASSIIMLSITFQLVLCTPTGNISSSSGSILDSDVGATISSFDFVVKGNENRLDGLGIASLAAGRRTVSLDSEMMEEHARTRDSTGFVVIDGANNPETGVFDGDLLLAVNGVRLSDAPLSIWIESSITAATTVNGTERSAVFPLVDVVNGGGNVASLDSCSRVCVADRNAPARKAAAAATTMSGKSDDVYAGVGVPSGGRRVNHHHHHHHHHHNREEGDNRGERGGGGQATGFPLSGFLIVKLVQLADAEVTLRPGESRTAALVKERRDAAEAEKKERDRVALEANAVLEASKKKMEEENRAKEATARAKQAEQAKEKAAADKAAKEKQQEEARVRREEEAAAKATKKSKADLARMRKEGLQFVFSAEYKEVAPMGLTFDLANPLAVVSEVIAGGLSYRAGVLVGDHLVQVNERDTSKMKPSMAMKVLQRTVWPRVLTFSTPETAAAGREEEPLLLELVVTDPEIVRGEYLIQAPKGWGGGSLAAAANNATVSESSWSCEGLPVALADPPSACRRDLGLRHGDIEVDGRRQEESVIVVVKRGVCTFVEKAKNVQLASVAAAAAVESSEAETKSAKTSSTLDVIDSPDGTITITTAKATAASATTTKNSVTAKTGEDDVQAKERGGGRGVGGGGGGGGGMVLLNGEDVIADMPAGNLLTDDVTIPVAMISQGNGSSLEALVSWGVAVRAAIVPLGACTRNGTTDTDDTKKARKDNDDGGRLLVLAKSSGGAEFDYRQALYGPGVDASAGERRPWGIAVAEPYDGCDDKAYRVRVAGMFVAVERGGCSFSMKTLAAQRAGAAGVIIMNTAEVTLRVMADKGDEEKALIPTIMVSAKAGRFLSEAAGSNRSPILGRFTKEDFYGDRG